MALATLSIDVLAKIASFEAGMDKAARIAQKAADQVQARWDKLGAGVAAVGGTLGVALSSAALATTMRNVVDGLDALNDWKDATGASIENLSALEDIAARAGGSMEVAGSAVVKLNKVLSEAKPGSAQAEVLKAIGLEAEELRRIDPVEALMKVAQGLAGFEDNANKARIVQELFGKSIGEVAPLLNDLAEKGELVATVTAEQTAAAERFNKQLAQLQKNASDTGRALVSELLPAVNRLYADVKREGGLWNVILGNVSLDAISKQRKEVENLGLSMSATQFKLNGLLDGLRADPENRAMKQAAAKARADLGVVQQELAQANERLKAMVQAASPAPKLNSQAGAGRGFIIPDVVRPSLPDVPDKPEKEKTAAVDRLAKAYDDLIARLRERAEVDTIELATGERATEVQKLNAQVLADLEKAEASATATQLSANAAKAAAVKTELANTTAIMQAVQARREQLRVLDEQVMKMSREADAYLQGNAQLRESIALWNLNADQVEAVMIARYEAAAAAEEEALGVMLLYGASDREVAERQRVLKGLQEEIGLRRTIMGLTAIERRDAANGTRRAISDYGDEVARAGDEAYRFTRQGIDGLEDHLTQFFTKGKADWSSYFQWIATESLRMQVIRPAISAGGSWLSNALGLASIFSGGIPAANTANLGDANAVGLLDIGRARGGPVQAGSVHPVLEEGRPELLRTGKGTFLLSPDSGDVTPVAVRPGRGGAGQGRSVVINSPLTMNIDAAADRSQLRAEFAQALKVNNAMLLDQMERGLA